MEKRRFTERANEALQEAQSIMRAFGHPELLPIHIFYALITQDKGTVPQTLEKLGFNPRQIAQQAEMLLRRLPSVAGGNVAYISVDVERILAEADRERELMKDDFIGTEHLMLGFFNVASPHVREIMSLIPITKEQFLEGLKQIRGSHRVSTESAESQYSALEKYSRDLTELARLGKLDPVVGREKEINRTIQVLLRRRKNNPVLIGDAGVGKTAIVEGLAQRIVNGEVPPQLKDIRIVQLDMASLIAGTKYRGEFEERLKAVINEIINSNGKIIPFIDEIHTVVGAGSAEGGMDASNILKPPLSRGELRCIGATTTEEYRRYIEKDPALERRFQPIYIEEPTVKETVEILKGLRDNYEKHHNVKITDEAIETAAKLSHRFISDRKLPDKAIDVIDETAARLSVKSSGFSPEKARLKKEISKIDEERLQAVAEENYEKAAELKVKLDSLKKELEKLEEKEKSRSLEVTPEEVAVTVSEITKIPVKELVKEEREKLLNLEKELSKWIIGQEEAIKAVSSAIRRSHSGIKDPNRPIGSFLFLGPTGVGKTELAKRLAEILFGSKEKMIRLDMSEFMEKHSVSKLIGAPPGYVGYEEGGKLTEAVRRNPYSIVLFDEIEKAHPEVFNVLLQILEEGTLTDSQGKKVSFRNTVIIMTSNIASDEIREMTERGEPYEKIKEAVKKKLLSFIKPEILNRIDEFIVFHPLKRDQLEKIAELLLKELKRRLEERGINLVWDSSVPSRIVEIGYDPSFGARPLRRVVQKRIEDPLSVKILENEFGRGDTIKITVKEGEFHFEKE